MIPEWLTPLTNSLHHHVDVGWDDLLFRLVAAALLGLMVAAVYHVSTYTPQRGANRTFLATLVLLSVLIAVVTIVIGNSIGRAFTLVGTLSLVRFRTVVEDTRESAFVIFAVGTGMASGVGFVLAPLMAAPMVLAVGLAFRSAPLQRRRPVTILLRIGSANYREEPLTAVLTKHIGRHRLTGLATARGGAALDVSFEIVPPTPQAALALVAELSRLEGVQNVEIKE